MEADQRILARLNELVEQGRSFKEPSRHANYDAGGFETNYADTSKESAWATSCLSLLDRVFSRSSVHFNQFNDRYQTFVKHFHNDGSALHGIVGVMEAAKNDYEGGHLFDIRALIEADVFADFLEQATELLEKKFHAPAAVVAGCVLEDGLRKLSVRHGLSLPEKPKPTIDTFRIALYKEGHINRLEFSKIDTLRTLRNDAAHGDWDKFTADDVKGMIEDVRRFMEKHFT